MEKISFLDALKSLKQTDLLNAVGEEILKHPVRYAATVMEGNRWANILFSSQEELVNYMAVSSLCSYNWDNAISEFVDDSEVETLRKSIE